MSTYLEAASIARLSLHDPDNFGIQKAQTIHRLELLQHWNIYTGSKILELGCGQGDCTAVLASAVGEEGRVVAVDPADLDYGASFRFSYPSACLGSGAVKQMTHSSFRCPIYPWRITGSPLANSARQVDYLGSRVPSGLPILPPVRLVRGGRDL